MGIESEPSRGHGRRSSGFSGLESYGLPDLSVLDVESVIPHDDSENAAKKQTAHFHLFPRFGTVKSNTEPTLHLRSSLELDTEYKGSSKFHERSNFLIHLMPTTPMH